MNQKPVSTRCIRGHLDQNFEELERHYHELRSEVKRLRGVVRKLSQGLTKAQRNALITVLDMAMENSCSCGDEEYSDRAGWGGHAADCHVHNHRKALKVVLALAKAKAWGAL